MDKLFIKQSLHVANTFVFSSIVSDMMTPDHSHGVGAGIAAMLFSLYAYLGTLILVLCPKKRISLGIIALGFVLCYYTDKPPMKYMGYITSSVGALIFWAYFGDKKWWLFPIPFLIYIVFFSSGWLKCCSVSDTLIFYAILLFPVLCTYPIRNAHWYLRFLGALVATWVFLYILIVFKPLKYLGPYIGT